MRKEGAYIVVSVAAVLSLFAAPSPASARITPEEYRAIGVTAPADAALPMTETVTDEAGQLRAFGSLITRPTVLVFADYTCRTLCGPALAFAAGALERSGLRPQQFQLLVVGIDPKDTAADALRMRRDHIGTDAALNSATTFVTADKTAIATITSALGYRYRYDADADQYVHPVAAFALRADGKVSRVLTELGLSGEDMRLALVEAGEGRIGTLGDLVRLLCSAFDPAHGTYNVMVSRLLFGTGLATILLLTGGIGLLALSGRRGVA